MPMRRDHFLDFHRAAESAGYPAMLIVSVVSLGAVVAPLVLLALTGAGWLLGVTLLGLVAALGLLAGEFNAAVSDGDEPPRKRVGAAAPADGDPVPIQPGVKPSPPRTARTVGRRSVSKAWSHVDIGELDRTSRSQASQRRLA
jgi:uncharacterized membrane protein YebE (DUF533 family)